VRMRNVKRWLASLLCVAMLFSTLSVFSSMPKAKAAGMSIAELQVKYPHNKYWNHYGMSGNNADGYTDHECTGHKYCNWFMHNGTKWSSQCMGFAHQLAYLYSGRDPISGSGWSILWYKNDNAAYRSAIDNVKTGDVITYYESTSTSAKKTHTVFVTGVSGETVYLAECNYGGRCVIHWGRTMTKTQFKNLVNENTSIRICPSDVSPNPDPDVDSLGCSTAYAGWYQVTYRTGASVNSGHNKNWNSKVGEIPYGQYVYISKATGTGSGNLGHITYNGAERYIAMGMLKRMSGDPLGSVDSYGADAGSVWLNGWAFDWDNCEEQLKIDVYLDSDFALQGTANGERSDVNGSYSGVVGSYHGFNLRINTNLTGSHRMDVYAINVGSGADKCLGYFWVDIPSADTTGPEISNVQVTNVTNEGYDVSCTVTDPSGVDKVMFPTWITREDGSNDLGDWGNDSKFVGTRDGDTWKVHINAADHENRSNYITDIRAWDMRGNLGSYLGIHVNLDMELPVISNVQVTNVTTEGYDVSCTVTDNVGVNRVQFPTWTDANGQDDLLSDWSINPKASGTRNGDTWTFHVSIADHNNERGKYITHIYAYDDAGNIQSNVNVASGVEVPVPDPTLTFDANGGTAEFDTKQAERGAAYGALPEAWMDGYVFDGWYTDAVGGDRVSSSTVYTAAGHTTLYAHWMPVASDAEQGWSLQDGTLIITSQGAMQDYTSARETPWFSDRADIRKIVVQNGVTSIGNYAFYGCENVTSVALPSTVTQIGKLAFYGCRNLSSLTLPDSLTMVEDYAFAKASGLGTIAFKGSAPLFGAGVFADVSAEVRYPAEDSTWTDAVRQSYTGNVSWVGVSEAELTVQTSDLQLNDPELEALLADSCV